MKTRLWISAQEKKIITMVLALSVISIVTIPIMTEFHYHIGTFGSAEYLPVTDLFLLNFYTHSVTYYDMFYLPGWYVGYSIPLPNLGHDLAHLLDSFTETHFRFILGSSVFGYLEAPPWDAVYVIPAMYLPLLAIIPSWILTRTVPMWRRLLYVYFIVTSVSVILQLILVSIL